MAGSSSLIPNQVDAATVDLHRVTTRRKIAALVMVHAVLSTAPLLISAVPPSVFFLPLIWLTSVGTLGALLTLSFWVGMGRGRLDVRLLLTLAGCAYIAIWPAIGGQSEFSAAILRQYGQMATTFGVMVAVFGVGFLVMRRWVSLRRIGPLARSNPPNRLQFSVRNILLLMALTAGVMTFVHLERIGEANTSTWKIAVAAGLGFGIFFINTIMAALAALGEARPAPRITATALIAWLLGIAMSIAMRQDEVSWWLVLCGGVIVTVLPTMIVVASLLIVRSCDYRLVPVERAG